MDPNTYNNRDRRLFDEEISNSSSRTASVNHRSNEKVGQDTFLEHAGGQEKPVNSHEKLRNPLSGILKPQLMADVEAFAADKGLMDALPELKKGALIAQDPTAFESLEELTEEEKEVLRREVTHRWSHPKTLYWMTSMSISTTVSIHY